MTSRSDNWNLEGIDRPIALLLHAHPEWRWHLVCLTLQPRTTRLKEYNDAIVALKNKGVNIESHKSLEKRDEGQILSSDEYNDWVKSIKNLRDMGLKPDIVFTHNSMGEYGHPHHMAVNKVAHSLFGNVWDFVFPGTTSIGPQTVKRNVNEIRLSPRIMQAKKEIFETAYTAQQLGLWQELPSLMEYEFHQGPEIYTA